MRGSEFIEAKVRWRISRQAVREARAAFGRRFSGGAAEDD
jgi:hypothetical protein